MGSPQLAEKFSLAANGHARRQRCRRAVLYFKRHEAHLPAKEAQARPRSRVPRAYELTRGATHAEAAPRQGTQAPHGV